MYRALRRHYTNKHIKRKEAIIKFATVIPTDNKRFKGHRLAKQKVHCSCPMCTQKSKRDGYRYTDKKRMTKIDVDE